MLTLLALTSFIIAAQTTPDWPPLPDFKTHVDYIAWYEGQVRGRFGPHQDAWPLYRHVFPHLDDPETEKLVPMDFAGFRTQFDPVADFEVGPWTPREHPAWEASHQRGHALLRGFIEATKRPYCVFPMASGPTGTLANNPPVNHLSAIRRCAKALSEAAWRAPGGHVNPRAFLLYSEATLRAAHQLDGEPFLISQLTAMACRTIAYQDLRIALARGVFTPPDLDRAIAMLRRADGEVPTMAKGIPGDAAYVYSLLEFLAGSEPIPEFWTQAKQLGSKDIHVIDVTEIRRMLHTRTVDAIETAKVIRAHLMQVATALDDAQPRRAREQLGRLAKQAATGNAIMRLLAFDFSRPYTIRLRIVAVRRATRLLFEMRAHRNQTGLWPGSLDTVLARVPAPFAIDPFSGRQFVYKLADGEPRLYSIAMNGKDDGGKHDESWGDTTVDADYVFWPLPAEGPQKRF